MSNINAIYTIDENYKKEKKKLLEKFEKDISEDTLVFLKKKKTLLSDLAKTTSEKVDSSSANADLENVKSDLQKKADTNKSKLEKFVTEKIAK